MASNEGCGCGFALLVMTPVMPLYCLYKAATGGDDQFTSLHYLAFVPVWGLVAVIVWGIYLAVRRAEQR